MMATLEAVSLLGFIQNIGPLEMMVILIVGLLLFGKRLPEVGRSLGKGIVEFKKGLRGIEDEMDEAHAPPTNKAASSDRVEAEAPRFELPNDKIRRNDD